MNAVWIVIAILILLLVYILLTPVVFSVNSNEGTLAMVRIFGLGYGRLWWQAEGEKFMLGGRLLWYRRSWDLETLASSAKNNKQKNAVKDSIEPIASNGKDRRLPFSVAKLKSVLRTFRIREFKVQFDSGDYPLNGVMYPVFFWLGQWSGRQVEINFENRNELVLVVENRLGSILWAWLFGK